MSDAPLMKDGLGSAAIKTIARHITQIIPNFNVRKFQRDAEAGLQALELKARVHHIISVLHQHHSLSFIELCKRLQQLPTIWIKGENNRDKDTYFAAWPIIDYVAVYGLEYPREALTTLEKLTPLFTAEFAVRPFILQHPEIAYAQLLVWAQHPSEHVRRLASEASRPRLPWAMQLPQFRADPKPLTKILQALKTDSSLYVRKSVANNLNDISKDNPAWAIALCAEWSKDKHVYTDWIVKHGMRTLIKAGDVRVFPLLGYTNKPKIKLDGLMIKKSKITLGEDLTFSFLISSDSNKQQQLVVDYCIYHMKANGKLAPKVFKLKNVAFSSKESVKFTKNHSFKLINTRAYYAGLHQLAIQVNGMELARIDFYLK